MLGEASVSEEELYPPNRDVVVGTPRMGESLSEAPQLQERCLVFGRIKGAHVSNQGGAEVRAVGMTFQSKSGVAKHPQHSVPFCARRGQPLFGGREPVAPVPLVGRAVSAM